MKIFNSLLIIILFGFITFSGYAQPTITTAPNFYSVTLGCNNTSSSNLTITNTGSAALTYSTFFKYAYVCNYYENTVSVLNVTTNAIVGSPINVGYEPIRAALNPDGSKLYVANRGGNTVTVIRTSTNTVIDTIFVGSGPDGLAFTPDGQFLYVANQYDYTVSVVNCSTGNLVTTISDSGFDYPDDIKITSDGKYAYVPNRNTGVTVIDVATNTVIANILGISRAHSAVFSRDGKFVFITESTSNGSVVQIDIESNTIIKKIGSFDQAVGIDITPDGRYIYALDKFNDYIQIIDVSMGQVVDTIYHANFDNGWGLAISPDGKYAYVSSAWNSPGLMIVDIALKTVINSLTPSANGSWGIATQNNVPAWLSTGIEYGSVPAGNSTNVNLTFNSNGFNSGVYSYNLYVFSNDTVNPISTIPITMTVDGPPSISLSNNCLYYDTTYVSGYSDKILKIYNSGCDTLNVTSLIPTAQFTVSNSNLIVLPYDSVQVTVRFSPAVSGSITGSLAITSNDINTSVCLSGVGKLPPNIVVTPSSLSATFYGCIGDTITRILTIQNTGSTVLTGEVTMDHGSFDSTIFVQYFTSDATTIHQFTFDRVVDSIYVKVIINGDYDSGSELADVYIDGTFIETIPDGNLLETDIIRYYAFSGAQLQGWLSDGQISVSIDNSSSVNAFGSTDYHSVQLWYNGVQYPGMIVPTPVQISIPPGNSTNINVDFISTGLDSGIYSTYLFVETNDPDRPVDSVMCTLTVVGYPSIMLSSSTVNFGILMANSTKTDTVLIHNSGCAPLIISSLNLPAGAFSIINASAFPDTISPNEMVPLLIRFAPLVAGPYTQTLTIANNDINQNVTLNGTATPPAQAFVHPNPIDVTITNCNDSVTVPLYINNIGTIPLNYMVASRDSFYDNFENGLSKWTYSNPWGLQQSSFNGSWALTESPGGNYTNGMYTAIEMTNAFKIKNKQLSKVTYMMYCNTEGGYDYITTELSVNGGAWQQLYNFSGSSGWALYTHNLASYVNSGDMVKIRFRFSSDGSVISDGVLIDEVKIVSDGNVPWILYPGLAGTLAVGDSITVPVKFIGNNLINGIYSTLINVITNDPLQDTIVVPCNFTVNGQPNMTYSKTCIQYDSIFQFESKVDSVIFSNTACGTLLISNITHNNSAFQIDSTSFTIINGAMRRLTVSFNPLTPGHYYDTLNVINNDSNIRICLHGFAKYPPQMVINPSSLSITLNSCNDSILVPITISNTGNSNLNYSMGSGLLPAQCMPATTGYCCSMGIFNVTFNTINNSTSPGSDGYKDYTATKYTSVTAGNTYTLSVTAGTGYQENTRTWIDYNNNGIFESGEMVLNIGYHYGLCSQQITIPLTAKRNVALRMRVMSEYYYNSYPQPCQNVQYGQCEDYAVTIYDGVTIPVVSNTVTPGGSSIVNIEFNSTGLVNGTYSGTITITSNDPLNLIDTVPYTFIVNGTPDILVSASCVNFDSIFQYNSKTDSITILNQGCAVLNVSNITHNLSAFQIDQSMFNLIPGASQKVHITFNPITAGLFLDTLKIYNNDSLINICLRGYAKLPPVMNYSPASINVTLNNCNDSVTVPVIIHNTGNENLIWSTNSFMKNSLQFNGSNTYVNVTNYNGFPSGNTSITVEAWVYPTGYPDASYNGIVSYGGRYCTGYGFLLAMTNAGRPSYASWCNDFTPTTGPTASLNTWHYVAAVLTGNQVTLYLDNYSWTTTLTYTPNIQLGNLMIGSTDSPGRIFNGKIDEVRMWNYALPQSQLMQNMYNSVNPLSSGLVAYWNFNEGTGTTLNDLTGHNHTGVITGASWSTSSPVGSQFNIDISAGNIIPGGYDTASVTFFSRNLISGTYYHDIILSSNDPLSPSDTIHGTFILNGYPVEILSKNCMSYDTIMQFSQTMDSLYIKNTGCDTLKVSGITSNTGQFSTPLNTFNVMPGDSVKLVCTYYPQIFGSVVDTLYITSNTTLKKVCLKGFAYRPPVLVYNPQSLNVTVNTCNDSVTVPLTINNPGDTTLTWSLSVPLNNSGNALSFNGSNSYVLIPNSNQFDLATLTMEAWVFSNNFNQNGFIFEKGPVNSQYSMFFEGASFCFRTYNSGGGVNNLYVNSASIGISNGSWHHIVCTYDGANKKIYVDGILRSTQAYNQTLRTGQLGEIIGAYGATGGHSYFFNGKIDEVRVWSYARSAQQISQNMSHMLAGNETGLVGYWNFNTGSGTVVSDNSGHGHNGTITLATWTTSASPIQDMITSDVNSGTNLNNTSSTVFLSFHSMGLISGTYNQQVYIYSNDPLRLVDTIPCSLIVNGYPIVSSTENCLTFDSTMQYTSVTDTFYIRNSGCDSLHVTNITHVNASFQPDITAFNVYPGDSQRVIVTFQPLTYGIINDTISIINNDSLVKICLNGYAYKPPVYMHFPDTLEATINTCNDTVIVPLSIYNAGDTTLTFNLAYQSSGKSLQFDGSNDNVDLGTWFNYQSFTIEMWVNPGSTQQQYADIIDNNHNGSRSFVLQQNSWTTNQYTWGTNDGGGPIYINLNPNQWTHIALVRDGNTKVNKVYINGILLSSYTGTSAIPYDGTQFLRLCRWGGGGRYWNGLMDEVRVWNIPRTQQQIVQAMSYQFSGNISGLVASWNFEEGTGTVLNDLTGNGHNGTINGATWSAQHSPVENMMNLNQTSGNISATDTTVINVSFFSNNITSGTHYTQITVNTNDPLNPTDSIPCILHFNGHPVITFADTCVIADTTIQYTSTNNVFTIFNTGCDTLFISTISSSVPEFSIAQTNLTILPGDSVSVTAVFQPLTVGNFNSYITVHSNIADLNHCIFGVSVPPPVISFEPDSVIINMTACNDTLIVPVTIKNVGSYTLSYSVGSPQIIAAACNPATTQYCCGVGITRVQFNTINYVTPDGSDGYKDYTSTIQTQVMAGNIYPVTIKTGSQFNENVCLWIDLNNNGSFEPNEKLFESLDQLQTHSGNITIPSSSVMQTPLRMRVGSDLATNPVPLPCVNSQFGQFEDYKIIIGGGLSVTNGTGNIIGGDSSIVYLHINAQQTTAGNYTYNLPINSNDPLNPLVYVPCNITISPRPDKVVARDTSICDGSSTPDMTSTGTNVEWFNDIALTSLAHSGNTFVTGFTATGIYTWYVTQTLNNCNSIPDTVTLAIYAIPSAPTAADVIICLGNPNDDLYASGTNVNWYTDSLLTNQVYTGNTFNTGNTNVGTWTYYLTQTINGCTGPKDSAVLTIHPVLPSPVVHDTLICYQSPNPLLTATGLQIKWYTDSTLLTLVHTGTGYTPAVTTAGVHKFYVTQTDTINGCESNPSVNTFSIFLPEIPVSSDTAICYGQMVPDLYAAGTNIQWYSDAGLTTLVHSGDTFYTGLDTVGTFAVGFHPYYVTQTDTIYGCQSLANTTVLTIWGIPAAPATPDETICFGQPTQPIIATGSNIIWYSGINIIHNGNTYTPVPTTVGTYTYLLTQTVNNCPSPADTVIFTINPLPVAPVGYDTTVCAGNPVPDLIVYGSNIKWYSDITLLNLVHSGDTLVSGNTNMGTYLWYVTQTISGTGCQGPYSLVSLTIDSLPILPLAADKSVCFGFANPAFNATGTNVNWYADAGLTTFLQTGNSYTSTASAVGVHTYYVTQTNNCGQSSPTIVTLTINAIPSSPVLSSNSTCFGQPNTLLTAAGTNIKWASDSLQTIVLSTLNTYIPTVTASGLYDYWATQTVNSCQSPAGNVSYVINALPQPPVTNDQFTCNAVIPPLVATGTNILWYDSLNNVVSGDTLHTGMTQLGVYTYYATQTNSGTGCESNRDTVLLTISTYLTNPPVTHDTASCFEQTVPALTAQGINVNWYGDPALTVLVGTGASFQSTSTGPGTYTYYLNQQNICGFSPSISATLTIHSLPATPVTQDTSTCQGIPINITATGTNISWYQNSNLSNLLQTGNTYAPPYTVPGIYVYYLNSTDLVTGCNSVKDSVIFTINTAPVPPVANDATACYGGLVPDLTATGVLIQWYTDSLLTNNVGSGNTLVTGQTNIGSYTYYLTQTNSCGTSLADSVKLIIGNQPGLPITTNDTACFGSSNPALVVPGSNINWYTDTALTQHVFLGNSYTPAQTAVGTYTWYVTQTTAITGCISDYAPVSFVINNLPASPVVTDTSTCYLAPTPTFNVSGNNVIWYSDPGLNTIINTGSVYTPVILAPGVFNYYITQTVNSCASIAAHMTYTINALPAAPITVDDTVCEGGIIPLLISAGSNQIWYSDAALTTVVSTGNSYQPVVNNPGVYNWYVTQTVNGCEGTYDIASLTINTLPLPPAASDDTICFGQATPTFNAAGINVVWYSNPALTTILYTGNNYQPTDASAGIHQYYVTQTSGGCRSNANEVLFVVFDASLAPDAMNNTICKGSVSSLTAIGVNIHWYSDAALTNLIYVGSTLTTNDSLPGTYTYYATQAVSTCGTSGADPATLTINAVPQTPVANDVTVCFGTLTPSLIATGSNINWYSEPEQIILVNVGQNFNTGNTAVGTYTYYATQSVNGCISSANDVVLTINPTPLVTLNKYHVNINEGSNVTLIAYNAASYSWTPGTGLSTTTGPVVVASPLQTTTYIVTGTSTQGCSDTARCVVEVGQIGVAENSFEQYLSVFPNPTTGDLNIKFVSWQKEPISLKIMNQLGQVLMYKRSEQTLGLFNETISLEGLADGVYYLQVLAEKGVITKKIVLKR